LNAATFNAPDAGGQQQTIFLKKTMNVEEKVGLSDTGTQPMVKKPKNINNIF